MILFGLLLLFVIIIVQAIFITWICLSIYNKLNSIMANFENLTSLLVAVNDRTNELAEVANELASGNQEISSTLSDRVLPSINNIQADVDRLQQWITDNLGLTPVQAQALEEQITALKANADVVTASVKAASETLKTNVEALKNQATALEVLAADEADPVPENPGTGEG